jgi:ArsR family transcriptional regulator
MIMLTNEPSSRRKEPAADTNGDHHPELAVPDLPALPDETARDLAQLFKLLADETRLRVLFYLMRAPELNVRTLCELLSQSQPAVSHHLALLRVAGLIESRRDGKHNFYRIIPKRFQELVEMFFSATPDQDRQIQLEDYVLSYEPAE